MAIIRRSKSAVAGIGKMNTHRFIPVFSEKSGRKYNLGFTENKSGVYIIKENGVITYIGYSSYNLYKTITRHFQSWDDPRQRRVTYVNSKKRYTIRVVLTSASRAIILERALIEKYRPRDNEFKLNMIDMSEKEVAKIKKQNKAVIEEYESEFKNGYPPDWDL